jgi:hypothetical protein
VESPSPPASATYVAVAIVWIIIGGLSFFFYSVAPMDSTDRLAFWLYFCTIPISMMLMIWRIPIGTVAFCAVYIGFNFVLLGGAITSGMLWPFGTILVFFLTIMLALTVFARDVARSPQG